MRERLPDPQVAPNDPCETAMAADEAQRLYRALYQLDARERTVLVLHYLHALSYRAMALVLDEPTGTVKWRTAEALQRLRALLCDEVSDHVPRTTSEPGSMS